MIIKEFYRTRNDKVNLYKTYSDDETMQIKQTETGAIYDIAIDVESANYHYTEVKKTVE